MTVYLINFRSSGELWHSCVALNRNAVTRALASHGINQRVFGDECSEFEEFERADDKTQTATISKLIALE